MIGRDVQGGGKVNLYHYSDKPFVLDRDRTYDPKAHFKPCGLWLSVEDDWQRWCEGEEFNLGGLTHRTQIVLNGAKILLLEDTDALDAFTDTYRLTVPPYDSLRAIDWPRVVARYDGIIIAPYMWERRLSPHTFWYYCWDCASACVWNTSVLEVVQETEAMQS
jgi:hypothetical protein